MNKIKTQTWEAISMMLPKFNNPCVRYTVTDINITCWLEVPIPKHLVELIRMDIESSDMTASLYTKTTKRCEITILCMSKYRTWKEYNPWEMQKSLHVMWSVIRLMVSNANVKHHDAVNKAEADNLTFWLNK